MNPQDIISTICVAAIPVIFAITVHEAAHGYAARHFGDMTAHAAGRISLNPIRHIDPIGTVLVPLLLLIAGSSTMFGWAKPVPVDFSRLRDPKKDMLWVAAAGPGANLLMAFFWACVLKISGSLGPGTYTVPLMLMGYIGIRINVVLMVLNLLPLPPLDGGRIAVSLLPRRQAARFSLIEPYGMPILFILVLIPGVLSAILSPPVGWVFEGILSLFSIHLAL